MDLPLPTYTPSMASASYIVPFPSSQNITFPSSPTIPVIPTPAELIAGTVQFQDTLSRITESIRLMRPQIQSFRSTQLLLTAEEFETDILSLVAQIREVADQCVDMQTDEGEYELACSNIRWTLQQFIDTVHKRRLDHAAIALPLTEDAMYTFMEVSVREVSGWISRQPQLSNRHTFHEINLRQRPIRKVAYSSHRRSAPPEIFRNVPPVRERKQSVVQRLRAISMRRSRKSMHVQPELIQVQELERALRTSMDRMSRSAPVVGSRRPPPLKISTNMTPRGPISPVTPSRLTRVLNRCKSSMSIRRRNADYEGSTSPSTGRSKWRRTLSELTPLVAFFSIPTSPLRH